MQSLLETTGFLSTKYAIDLVFVLRETNKSSIFCHCCGSDAAHSDTIELLYGHVDEDPFFSKPPLIQDVRHWKYRAFDSAHCTRKQPTPACSPAVWPSCHP